MLFHPGCFKLCSSQGWGTCIFIHGGFVPYQPGVQLLNYQVTAFLSLRNLHLVLLMSVSGLHFLPHCTSVLFCAGPSPSSIVCNRSVMGILLTVREYTSCDLQFSGKEQYGVCFPGKLFLCIRGCDENSPLEIGFLEACPPMNSVLIPAPGRLWVAGELSCLTVLAYMCTPQCLFYGCSCEKWPPGQAFFRRRHPESFCKVFFPPPWVVNEWNEAKHRAQGLSVFLSSPFCCPGESKPSKIPVHVGVSRTWGSSKEGGSR